jgi:hypothetical protein
MKKSANAFEQLELKYCERCGGLWLRRKGSQRVYCVTCVPKMNDMPLPRPKTAPRLQLPSSGLDLKGCALELVLFVQGGQ